ncbi:hypothetical protein [Raineyella fluvialis]|uniref:Magnesium transporter NIPA n=1 Tax=Raineyella fluvialis TaxID=2662261 RepID=A0A5Q2FDW9_9ACTN|nr:hypothetical protein [Raineyella fluvialis]QGF24571.1 hypothetical protein Rai3103_14050 [Raineyella fluvialis]
MQHDIPLAILLTIGKTVVFAVAATLQHQAVGQRSGGPHRRESLSVRQLWSLIRSPRWWLGAGLNGLGAVLSVGALVLAPLTVVAPLAVLAVPWTVILASRIHRFRVPPLMWAAVGLTVAGTAGFTLVAVAHTVDHDTYDDKGVVAGVLVVFAAAGLLALLGWRGPRAWRCLAWASAGSVIFGQESGLIRVLGEYVRHEAWRGSVIFWALGVALVLGSLLAGAFTQQGYAHGPAETVMGTTNAAAPMVAVLFGIAVLGEGAALTPPAAVMMVVAAALGVIGVVLLSHFHPHSRTESRTRAALP